MGAAMKKIAHTFFAVAALNSQLSCAQPAPSVQYSQKTLLKNWTLSRCLAQAGGGSFKADASASASAYLEFGKQPLEAYEQLSELIEKRLDGTYRGSIESRFDTMKCIDLFHSPELDELTSKMTSLKK